MGVPYRIFLGLSIAVFSMSIAQRSLTLNCDEVRANPPEFPLSYVNECSQRLQAGVTPGASAPQKMNQAHRCGEFTCTNQCILGWIKDEFGCPTCLCAQDGTSGNFEGDIKVVGEMVDFIKQKYGNKAAVAEEDTRSKRSTTRTLPLWKMYKSGDNYILPYTIQYGITSQGQEAIKAAAEDFAKYTCIRLQPRSNEEQYINFYPGNGCNSPVGAINIRQDVSLGPYCWYKGTVIHEVLHSLGFWHEQSRPDRDNHVWIIKSNILPYQMFNFDKFTTTEIDSMGSPYDTGSVMHYSSYDFTSNGLPTITDMNGNALVTQRDGFSKSDIEQLNKLYGCKNTGADSFNGTEAKCEDKDENCEMWAEYGECNKNPTFMHPNCCKSCKSSTMTTTTMKPTTTTTRATTTTGGQTECKDTNRNCESWSSHGHCTKNPGYMLTQCCKSCKAETVTTTTKPKTTTTTRATTTKPTTEGPTECKDTNHHCESWSSTGHCTKNPGYMLTQCCKSCKAETPTFTTKPTNPPKTTTTRATKTTTKEQTECKDTNRHCESWSNAGHCTKNPGYMLTKCCKSCRRGNSCEDKQGNCSTWASKGYCSRKHRDFMLKYCQKSCHFC